MAGRPETGFWLVIILAPQTNFYPRYTVARPDE